MRAPRKDIDAMEPLASGGRAAHNMMRLLRAMGAVSILALGCARDAGAPDRDSIDLRLDLRVFGGGAALGNAASVLERITLSISLPNQDVTVFTQIFTVAPTDSMVETTVDLSPGPYQFNVNAFSNNGTTIYALSTIAFLDDGTNLELVPQATNAVLVVGPADADLNENLVIRNAGDRTLLWIANCLSASTGSCDSMYADRLRGTLAAGASETMLVCSFLGQSAVFTIGFSTAVGTVTVRKAAPVASQGNTPC
jgi:hypothetical protein